MCTQQPSYVMISDTIQAYRYLIQDSLLKWMGVTALTANHTKLSHDDLLYHYG